MYEDAHLEELYEDRYHLDDQDNDELFDTEEVEEDQAQYTLTGVRADHGTIVVFDATDEDGESCTVAVEHRPAQAILEAIQEDGDAIAWAPDWAVQYL